MKRSFFFVLALFVALLSIQIPVFAVEVVDLEPISIYRKVGETDIRQDSYYVNKTGIDYHGFDIAPPVPIYSDGDHVSIYFDYEWQVFSNLPFNQNLLVSPRTSATAISASIGSSILPLSGSTSYNVQNFEGSFTWQSSSTCSYNLCYGVFKDPNSDYWVYSIKGVFDFNLIKEVEMLPIRMGVYIPLADSQYSVAGRRVAVKVLDTTTQELIVQGIDEIVNAIDNASVHVDLSSLDSYFNAIINNQISISEALSELVESTDIDEDVTRWASEVDEFNSMADELSNIESSYIDALNDFTFPEVPDSRAVGNILNGFFDIPLFLSLTTVGLSLTVVFLLIGKK